MGRSESAEASSGRGTVTTQHASGIGSGGHDILITTRGVMEYDGPPLYLFIGISTAGSSVFDAFPRWAPIMAPGGALRGVDLPESAPRDASRKLAIAMRNNPHVFGAVITSHKLRLYEAIHDLIDSADALTEITHEISALDTRSGVRAYARRPWPAPRRSRAT